MQTCEADEGRTNRENQLKAAYLLNFVKFVEWPAASARGTLTVCILGADDILNALAAGIESKKVGQRPLAVRRLGPTDKSNDCDVLYVDATALSSDPQLAARDPTLPLLTVSNAPGFARNGGMIELFTESNRLRFSINVDNAQNAGLRISSGLLQLAASVERSSEQ
jgi:hypothetical protein